MQHQDALARRNALVLALASVFAGANAAVLFATAAIIGQRLGPSPAWTTAPITAFVLGTAGMTLPAAHLATRIGRRRTYQAGTLFGILAGLTAALAIRESLFWLFMGAAALCGAYQAFVVSYRFGATDQASPAFIPRAVSWVLLGGLVSAFVGPQLVIFSKDLIGPHPFIASYLLQAAVALLAMLCLGAYRNGPPPSRAAQAALRPLREVVKSPHLRVAFLAGATAQSLMNYVMTAAPLAMVGCAHTTTDAALGIQWHIVGMYLPGFFTGQLIGRFGVNAIMQFGLAILALCAAVAMAGVDIGHFFVSMILLGVGWNFAFVGATTLVATKAAEGERTRVQGFNDFVVFGVTAVASLLAGRVLTAFGWSSLNLSMYPLLLVAACGVAWLSLHDRRARAP